MKVTKAQAQANRAHVVETASVLFRERGYEGIGIADLMAAAGFTHGGFYKQFRSKADLMAESAACGLANIAAQTEHADKTDFVKFYLSRGHRDSPATGCTMAALGADAARQPEEVREAFAAGVENLLAALDRSGAAPGTAEAATERASNLDMMAHAIGAIVLSRSCPDDSPLADEIIAVSRDQILSSLQPSN
ncbi:TetR/AcrR family transcriptional regulator [Xanthomonas hortorum pv. vitians]|uniref:TetR family transcriptional regulator n=3 Tax=Xanthomonas hortorum TaxID=56454 RepID=A0A6V7DUX4_9XANT|nr:TetR family transcriptional regulator [Xanthomonas hortorum]APP84525.1 TetR family transcriptional regulator [Xanthomonas hortorum pv. gardneri]ASW45622.1 TetR family transcriptional regulator [Xanthomonas hortorum]MCE4282941.1 TetR/AcrR family transcriptional regulator [Xanthomonas hortorum pv. vitians]MCE4285837.1 TetR/AcrR family transcriptional regulator [Xanthomonas hortorum pv. vitians]MCE4288427.1 TetR/AcrR family transcriptional regulator [Xanthomonas hortorum pv. vitians]